MGELSCPGLLRGITVAQLLEGFGQILDSPGLTSASPSSLGGEETYAMSRSLERLDVFVSHSWRAPRLLKVLTLCFYFNLVPALLAFWGSVAFLLLFHCWVITMGNAGGPLGDVLAVLQTPTKTPG